MGVAQVAEAKARKKMRANRRLDRLTKSADYINENPDMSEKEKSSSIAKLVAKASRNPTKAKKDMTKVVVARGINKGNVGRPKGVKGRYKMVDSRMKKEVRAAKRVARAAKGKGKSKKGK
jgi:AdoMet-dependent rRNA methyltransferase SPB1